MRRPEVVATLALPCLLGLALIAPRPVDGSGDPAAGDAQSTASRLYAWNCGGFDAMSPPTTFKVRAPGGSNGVTE